MNKTEQSEKIELYDIGRVITCPFEQGYKFIAEQGEKYIGDEIVLERIRNFHKDRSLGMDQHAFNYLNYAWVQAIRNGDISVDTKQLIYSDVVPRFEKVHSQRDKVFLLTSGSIELTDLLLGDVVSYDGILVGEEIGDKNNPDTYINIAKMLNGRISCFFDDKLKVIEASYEGFRTAGISPKIYLVDRLDKVDIDIVKRFQELYGIMKIRTFDEIK